MMVIHIETFPSFSTLDNCFFQIEFQSRYALSCVRFFLLQYVWRDEDMYSMGIQAKVTSCTECTATQQSDIILYNGTRG